MPWFLRSFADGDTHRGRFIPDTNTVAAVCGATFTPRPLLAGRLAFLGHPPDPDQCCPVCARKRTAS